VKEAYHVSEYLYCAFDVGVEGGEEVVDAGLTKGRCEGLGRHGDMTPEVWIIVLSGGVGVRRCGGIGGG
jgi:hypothetical protein